QPGSRGLTRKRLWFEADREAGWAMHVQGLARLPGFLARSLEALQTLQQIRERDPRLHSGEGRAQTGMDAVAKRQVRVGVARDVETISTGKLLRITVR